MSNRLDRLIELLDKGSTPIIRKSAAAQIGEVVKLHPAELDKLLARIHVYLRSKSWETRIAAGHAFAAIASKVPEWHPETTTKSNIKEEPVDENSTTGQLSFDTFNLETVLLQAKPLLGSQGFEYDVDEEFMKLDPKERLQRQRNNLKNSLGLGDSNEDNMNNIESMFDASDIHVGKDKDDPSSLKRKRESEEKAVEELIDLSGMSKRQRRKALMDAKKNALKTANNVAIPGSSTAHVDPSGGSVTVTEQADPTKVVVESKVDLDSLIACADEWPFQFRCDQLVCEDLFHPQWERRHGAAVGLREIIKEHGGGAGKSTKAKSTDQVKLNAAWLDDMALRLLCVCALDRFGDFGSDQVIAPVRNSCAQALGFVVKYMSIEAVKRVLSVLLNLQDNDQWEIRHGGLLGVKYLVAVRSDLTTVLLDNLLPVIFKGLRDSDDDVRAAAAEAIQPIAEQVVLRLQQSSKTQELLRILWNALLDLDDLTVSTGSVLELLAEITHLAPNGTQMSDNDGMVNLVPRLFPFFRHTLASVRRSVLRTIRILAKNVGTWLTAHLESILRLTFQNLLVEEQQSVINESIELWAAILTVASAQEGTTQQLIDINTRLLGKWLGLLVTPAGSELSAADMLIIHHSREAAQAEAQSHGTQQSESRKSKKAKNVKYMDDKAVARAKARSPPAKPLIGGSSQETEPNEVVVLEARHRASSALGALIAKCEKANNGDVICSTQCVTELMKPNSAIRRYCGAILVRDWGHAREIEGLKSAFPSSACTPLLSLLTNRQISDVSFMELTGKVVEMRSVVVRLVQVYSKCGILTTDISKIGSLSNFSVVQANELLVSICPKWDNDLASRGQANKGQQIRIDRQKELRNVLHDLQTGWQSTRNMIQGASAAAVAATGLLPEKISPIIKPLMDSIKTEKLVPAQEICASALSKVLMMARSREKCPNGKVIKNLTNILCQDPEITPLAASANSEKAQAIITLARLREDSPTEKRKPGKQEKIVKETEGLDISGEQVISELAIGHRGASFAFAAIGTELANRLTTDLPSVFNNENEPISAAFNTISTHLDMTVLDRIAQENTYTAYIDECNSVLQGIQCLETLTPSLDKSFLSKVEDHLEAILQALRIDQAALRFKAATCLASCANWDSGRDSPIGREAVMKLVAEKVLPRLGDTKDVVSRRGASEAIYQLVSLLDMKVIPYIVILVIPMLGRMSDFDGEVRELVSRTFAMLMTLMPLEAGVANPHGMSMELVERKKNDRKFLDQLLDSSNLEHYTLPTRITATLRSYQQDGLNWMNFLNKYQLHGILCDDMGLGKTLQSICMIVGSHTDRAAEYDLSQSPDQAHMPSIVVCPTTLVVHWADEFNKWCSDFKPLKYMGTVAYRKSLRSQIEMHDVIILSYETIRSESDYFSTCRFNYCVLDEGHIIKNPKSKMSIAVKKIQSKHRILLSGTPIQNNVLELWSIFDFLMPGFLGTEKQFNTTYGKPIMKMRHAKAKSKEQEAGTLALERLHRQVLPFLLRRMKEDVLSDLPPKIIQDYHCGLSNLQQRLYGAFAKSQVAAGLGSGVDGKPGHVFQALQYLRKVCNHPGLVLNPAHPWWDEIQNEYGGTLGNMEQSGKLTSLLELLRECGFGQSENIKKEGETVESAVGQHRCLIFAQSKKMLDLITTCVLDTHLPNVTHARLDGSVRAGDRQQVANNFNNDPTIDLLLLTTSVGGLGLTLTGADTVIFVEHDWNPSKDRQAMDRAHRIGQTKCVNVYRLITRGTLEEKIMGLQKFKESLSNTVVSTENSSLASMGTDQLLDLFDVDPSASTTDGDFKESEPGKPMTLAEAGKSLGELPDEIEYESESLTEFMKSMKR